MDRAKYRAKAEALVAQMTIEEAASQLLHTAPAIERLNVPEYNWWNEALHGVARAGIATVFPQAIGMAASFDEELIAAEGEVIATEARAKHNAAIRYGDHDIYKGLTFWSPNINIFRDPRWGRGHETFGEDPTLTKHMGNAFIQSLQGEGETLKLAACAKHFAVHSGPEELRHSFDARPSEKDLWETYLPAFETAVKDAKVESVMGAYNAVNGEPACGNERLLKTILREEWGFEGHVVSDCWAVRDFHEHHHFTTRGEESASRAVRMGCDINCGCTYERLLGGLAEGLITEEEIRESAIRAFTTRYALGMWEEKNAYHDIPYTAVNTKEHRALARKAAEESLVLLKNDGVLPLRRDKLTTIGVIGPNSYRAEALYGNYHGDSDCYVTNLDGIRDLAGEDIRVFYSQGIDVKNPQDDCLSKPGRLISEARAVIDCSDVVILCLGLDETIEGEEGDDGNQYFSGDKKDLLLPESQRMLLDAILPCEKPVILVLNSGSALDLSAYESKVNAIIEAWYSGEEGGHALARVIFGDCSPSGRLPVTFYYNDQELPAFTDYHMAGRTYKFLTQEPWYPFGYGLSYTSFAYEKVEARISMANEAQLPAAGAKDARLLTITGQLTNTGAYAGAEIIEVYARYCGEAYEKPYATLVGFMRVMLEAGESRDWTLEIPLKELYLVDEQGHRVLPKGAYELIVGGTLDDARSVALTGHTPCKITLPLE